MEESNLDPTRWLGYGKRHSEEWFTFQTARAMAVRELGAREEEVRKLP